MKALILGGLVLGFAFANPISLYYPPRYYTQQTPTLGYFQANPTILTHHESLAYKQPVTAPYSPPPPPPPPVQQEAAPAQAPLQQAAPKALSPNPSATNTTIYSSECITVCPVAPPNPQR